VFGFGGIFPPLFWWGYGYPLFPFYKRQLSRPSELRLRSRLQLLRQLSRLWLRLAAQRQGPTDLVLLL
jgi:hypothetical protein